MRINPSNRSDDLPLRGVGRTGHIAGVDRAGRLEAQNLRLFVGAGAMLDPTRHYDAFAGFQRDDMVAKLDAEAAAPNHEELVLMFVMVPREFAPHFH